MQKLISAFFFCLILLSAQTAQTTANQSSLSDLTPLKTAVGWGYANKDGELVIKPQFSRAHQFSEGLALVWFGGVQLPTDPPHPSLVKMGYIDQSGHWVIHSRFLYFFSDDFSEGLVPFRQQFSKWGYMDKTGKIIIKPQFSWAGSFSGGSAPVLLDIKCAHIDKNGKIIDQPQSVLPPLRGHRHYSYLFHADPPPCQ